MAEAGFPIVGEYASPDMQALTLVSVTQPAYGHSYVADSTTYGYDALLRYCNNGNPTDNFTITVQNPSGETETSNVLVYVPCS